VRDIAYGTLLRDRRRELHAAVARVLEERFPELAKRTPELLAQHLTEAGDTPRAVRSWLEAGRRAAERSADREAVSHLRRGLSVLAGLAASPERDRMELELQLAIGTPLIALSGWSGPEVAAAYERASELCEVLGESGRLARALFGLFSNRIVRGETRTALQLAEHCLAAAERQGDPVDRLLGHRAKGAALMQLGALAASCSEFEAIAALYDPERDRGIAATSVTDPRASGLSFLSLVLWKMGFPDRARRAAAEGFRHAARLRHANTTGHLLCHAGGELAQFLRDVPAARRHGEAAIALADQHGMPMWRGYGLISCGWAAAEEGRPAEGLALARARGTTSSTPSAPSSTRPITSASWRRSTAASVTRTPGFQWWRPRANKWRERRLAFPRPIFTGSRASFGSSRASPLRVPRIPFRRRW